MSPVTSAVRPFLKWAGGKRQLLPALRRFYPSDIRHYYEPFLGSGAVFFDLWSLGRLEGRAVSLTDGNADLIGCYLRVRDSVDALMAELEALADGHGRRGSAHYYEVRNERFNPARAAWRAHGGAAAAYTPALAAMLIYLNRTGYNGLFRQNARGEFNVPAGRYTRPRILDAPLLTATSAVLAAPQITIAEAPFERAIAKAEGGDFVYFDPPYAPLSPTSAFRTYMAGGFSDEDQARLQATAATLARRGVAVLLSNSTAPAIRRLYEQNAEARGAGLRTCRVPARRAINSRGDRRGVIEELLVSNQPGGKGRTATVTRS
ncbi:MAG: Dam family site-specific DNA-(adenine-N6)-methyltransferase [Vicinamibacterales bacterium]|nr:Dam family site-specific DNA-(adenine-N6)-methyltransferase [Vicinamibacterales bacterium]